MVEAAASAGVSARPGALLPLTVRSASVARL